MILFAIGYFLFHINNCETVPDSLRYTKRLYPGTEWPGFVHRQVADSNSIIECGAQCKSEDGACTVFALDRDLCYIGNPTNTGQTVVLSPQTGSLNFMIDQRKCFMNHYNCFYLIVLFFL